ncbi:hypothetical protein ABB02_00819 [Clostridiaceae bacterium JG1575]|nr:hypothetical protein ABB02_00819 [Clostridiaceae bacterium JG1575]
MNLTQYESMDPNIVYSMANARLRVQNASLGDFCDDNAIDCEAFLEYMARHGFHYHDASNQFRSV